MSALTIIVRAVGLHP